VEKHRTVSLHLTSFNTCLQDLPCYTLKDMDMWFFILLKAKGTALALILCIFWSLMGQGIGRGVALLYAYRVNIFTQDCS
jgi:hypothetical protein